MQYSDYDKRTALHIAAANGHLALVQFLVEKADCALDAKDKFDRTPIVDALDNKHNDVIEYLRKAGAKVDPDQYLETWMNAASEENVGLMKSLLVLGVNVNACDYDKRTALHIAVSK